MAEDIIGATILLQRGVIHDNNHYEFTELLTLSKISLSFKMRNENSYFQYMDIYLDVH